MKPESLRRLAQATRSATLGVFRAAGGFSAFGRSEWRQRRLLILCYHGISLRAEHEWDPGLFAPPSFLRRRLELLRKHDCNVLPLGEAVAALKRGTLPPRSVAITFDDGFHDFLAAAVPLLEEFGFPATNYLSTYYCIHQVPIPVVALKYVLWCARDRAFPAGVVPGIGEVGDMGEQTVRDALVKRLLAVGRSGDETQEVVAGVAAALGVNWGNILNDRLFHLMSPDEVAEAARRGFDIQLHTHRHRTPRDRDVFMDEIRANRELIESMTGRRASHFCYPSGDVDRAFLPWLHELGVETATTTAFPALARAVDDSLLLPRFVDTMPKPELTFASWITGAGAFVHWRSET